MLRTARDLGRTDLLRLAASARTWPSCPTPTSSPRPGRWSRSPARRAASARPPGSSGDELVPLWEPGQTGYVCGSASFAESLSQLLLGFGFAPGDVRIERFGPSG